MPAPGDENTNRRGGVTAKTTLTRGRDSSHVYNPPGSPVPEGAGTVLRQRDAVASLASSAPESRKIPVKATTLLSKVSLLLYFFPQVRYFQKRAPEFVSTKQNTSSSASLRFEQRAREKRKIRRTSLQEEPFLQVSGYFLQEAIWILRIGGYKECAIKK